MGCMLYFGSGIQPIYALAPHRCSSEMNIKSMVNSDLAGNSICHFL